MRSWARVWPSCDFARRVANVACRHSRSRSSPLGVRPNCSSNPAISSAAFAVTARRREEINAIASGATPTTSRDFPSGRVANATPNVRDSRSSVVRSATAPAAARHLYIALESRVRQTPSGPWTRLRTALWMCNCGS